MNSIRRHPLVFLLLCASVVSAMGQEPEPTPTPEESGSQERVSYVRVWSMLPPEVPPVEFGAFPTLKDRISLGYSQPGGTEELLLGRAKPYGLSSYQTISPGTFELRLVKEDAQQNKVELARENLPAQAGKFATVIISKGDSGYQLKVYRDELPPPPPAPADGSPPPPPPKEIIFFNFLPDTEAAISAKTPPISRKLASGAIERQTDLPKGLFMLGTAGISKGKPFSADTEVDLDTYDSMSYVLIEDRYGRTTAALLPNAVLE